MSPIILVLYVRTCVDIHIIYHPSFRFVINLMEDLVKFVIKKDNYHLPNILKATGSSDRDRQKLVREQNILKEVSGHVYQHHMDIRSVLHVCMYVMYFDYS